MGDSVIKICGRCQRIRKRDLLMGWCPFRATTIHYRKPAEKCIMFIGDESHVDEKKVDGDVR
jgi:hypothetical protein